MATHLELSLLKPLFVFKVLLDMSFVVLQTEIAMQLKLIQYTVCEALLAFMKILHSQYNPKQITPF